MEIKFITEDNFLKIDYSIEKIEEGISKIDFILKNNQKKILKKLKISWKIKVSDIAGYWTPMTQSHQKIKADWENGFSTKASVLAPVGCFYGEDNLNRYAVAYSDCLEVVNFNLGIHEESGEVLSEITIFNTEDCVTEEYRGSILIDERRVPYSKTIRNFVSYYENMEKYKPATIPDVAKIPMYSTWYSFHQELKDFEIEKQCIIAKEMGMDALITDDGWQTDDNKRGYSYTGDWEVSEKRFKNMKLHVEKIHDLEMKYILWYSVPFIGIKSKNWEKFKDKIIFYSPFRQAGVLDLRYPEVREYLLDIYVRAVKEWDIDGFKLDFIDQFDMNFADEKAKVYDKNRDIESLQEAVDYFLKDVNLTMRRLKEDFLIEFRQKYIGPSMRKYGNIFRANDCPMDYVNNRISTVDLRLFSGSTAVHSDMIMWSSENTLEGAARQFINAIYSVPQFSMMLDKLDSEYFKMSKFYLSFWKKNRDVLLSENFNPLYPNHKYPIISSYKDKEKIITLYNGKMIELEETEFDKVTVINGTDNKKIYLEFSKNKTWNMETYSVTGEVLNICDIVGSQLIEVEIPVSGMIILKKRKLK